MRTGLGMLDGAFAAGRDLIQPPLLRVTPTALLLPESLQGQAVERDEYDNPKLDGPRSHPEEIPFARIR